MVRSDWRASGGQGCGHPPKRRSPLWTKSAKAFLRGDAKTRLIDIGMEPAPDEAKPLAQVISEEIRIHADLVKTAGLVPQ